MIVRKEPYISDNSWETQIYPSGHTDTVSDSVALPLTISVEKSASNFPNHSTNNKLMIGLS